MPAVDAPVTLDDVLGWDQVAAAVAAQRPDWEPGSAHGYHARSFGWILGGSGARGAHALRARLRADPGARILVSPQRIRPSGAGGSLGFADPEQGIAFGYVMNRMKLGVAGDERSDCLVRAVYESL
ncbi:MAG: hypothetical protein ACRDQU_00525 [Pseudonocardiaceae bacterium]